MQLSKQVSKHKWEYLSVTLVEMVKDGNKNRRYVRIAQREKFD